MGPKVKLETQPLGPASTSFTNERPFLSSRYVSQYVPAGRETDVMTGAVFHPDVVTKEFVSALRVPGARGMMFGCLLMVIGSPVH
jgi:hypothetical protein